jgi:uncharacterized protein
MKIAIIGSGIAGNTLAHHLYKSHDITVYEANSHIGGHTHTHDVEIDKKKYIVDTGFIVFNDRTYPEFIQLLEAHQVAWQPSRMSFSVRCEATGFEYNGTTLNSLFAQRSNLFKPSFYQMIRDILRFNKSSLELLDLNCKDYDNEISMGDYLKRNDYGQRFINQYIIPMGAAIWSTDAAQMLQFPARFFVRFFHHHGMLSVNNRPQWRTITGGSARYVEAITTPFKHTIQLNTPVKSVKRHAKNVEITLQNGDIAQFDYVFFACHSDEALRMLTDATNAENEILSAIPYQQNSIYLHTDATLMPKRKLAWAAWNYHLPKTPTHKVAVTYNMNILQNIDCPQPILVTLNHTDNINPAKIIKRLQYTHPLYTIAGAAAQARHAEISGQNYTGYAGAYWLNGFHEDGVKSALAALQHFEKFVANA